MAAKMQGLDFIVTDEGGDKLVFEQHNEGWMQVRVEGAQGEITEFFVELSPDDQAMLARFLEGKWRYQLPDKRQ